MPAPRLEMWAGFECTLNRVGDLQHDQLARAGHYNRPDDIERLAALGVRTIRYPVLWERIETSGPVSRDWSWIDARMARIHELGVDPIVGLMHHGSGPMDTSLLDDAMPERLADFAGAVARRYPWVSQFTPINEPLTTARFSALYGVWHPHRRDDGDFLSALLNQVRATRLAMAAIRREIPHAKLVQTEDLGRTHSTPTLAGQAAFENERRWLTFDLLMGRVTPEHPLWPFFHDAKVGFDAIHRAVGEGCTPDLLGINHYITSERWLDDRLELYPPWLHGGNGFQRYADVEAVRARPEGVDGPSRLLLEAWSRYGIPMAVTEAHMGSSREQQLRWLHEMWNAALAAREAGADVRAVTAWAALGSHDWSSLATRHHGDYEPGLFDVRAPAPRPTALASMVRSLATDGAYSHPVLAQPGWWREERRLAHGARSAEGLAIGAFRTRPEVRGRPVLVTGAHGTLGRAIVSRCTQRGLHCVALGRRDLDVSDASAVARALDQYDAWAVLNAAGFVRVDDAEQCADECVRTNVRGPATLAAACAARRIGFVTFSSDLVFDGTSGRPYVERDRVAPLGVYGRGKAEAERVVLELHSGALVVRTAWFFGPDDDANFITGALRQVASGLPARLPSDLAISPTYVPHLADAVLDLLIDGERGLWHLASDGSGTVAEIARAAARRAGLDADLVHGVPGATLGFIAPRPPHAVLASERGTVMPTLDCGLAHYLDARGAAALNFT